LTGTPVAGLILVHAGIQVKAVEGDTLLADGDRGEVRSDFGIEPVAIHAEVEGGVAQPDEAGQQLGDALPGLAHGGRCMV